MKTCTKCGGEPKPLTEFYKDASKPDGFQSRCKPCQMTASAKWAAANPGKHRERTAKWQAKNPERHKAATAKWRAANSEKIRKYAVAWTAENPEFRRINEHNRRARKLAVGGKLSTDLAARLFKLQRGKCACCKTPLGDKYHRDHRMPLALGGSNTDDNIQLLCPTCNMQKHTKHPVDFMQSRGFLL